MHDVGKTGFLFLLPVASFAIVLGFLLAAYAVGLNAGSDGAANISLLILGASFLTWVLLLSAKSQPHTNKFGPNPHEVTP